MLDLSVNQSKEPNSNWHRQPKYGVFVHYLALTFKHAVEFSSFGRTPRRHPFGPAWGNSTTLGGRSTRVKSVCRSPKPTRTQPGEPWEAPSGVVAVWFLRVGRRSSC